MSVFQSFELRGFEDALRDKIAADFKFKGPHLENVPLVPGTHLYVGELPTDEDVKVHTPTFDGQKDPMIGIFTAPSQGLEVASGPGGKQDWTLRIILRINDVPERAKELCEELMNFVLGTALKTKIGTFKINQVLPGTRPVSFRREGDDGRLAQSIVRVLGVSLLN